MAGAYEVPDLLYPFEALEPFIDAPTMKIHHDKHHATYVANINKAMEGKDEVDILELQLNALEATPIRNSGVSEECISYVLICVLFISLHCVYRYLYNVCDLLCCLTGYYLFLCVS